MWCVRVCAHVPSSGSGLGFIPMLETGASLRISSYKSVPWSTWPRAFSNPFAEDNASYSS